MSNVQCPIYNVYKKSNFNAEPINTPANTTMPIVSIIFSFVERLKERSSFLIFK